MNTNIEARIAYCRCGHSEKPFGIRLEKQAGNWVATWAFKINPKSTEKYEEAEIKGAVYFSKEYPGCPYCGNEGVVVCHCGKLTCNSTAVGEPFRCAWCGDTGEIVEYTGGGIKTGDDA